MPQFTFSDQLPDPSYKRHTTGANVVGGVGDLGPGFASVKLTSDQKTLISRTNSQRVIARAIAGQKWKIDIGYNPMTRDEFDPVNSFLMMKQGPLTPFFVTLPQYSTPKNANWLSTLTNSNGAINGGNVFQFSTQGGSAQAAGATSLLIGSPNWNVTAVGSEATSLPSPGEIFTISDTSDSNHTKVYMITYVETRTNYSVTQPAVAHMRLGISPPLSRTVSSGSTLNFQNPLFKVIMPTAIRSYSLNTDNLYSFNLKLEEYL